MSDIPKCTVMLCCDPGGFITGIVTDDSWRCEEDDKHAYQERQCRAKLARDIVGSFFGRDLLDTMNDSAVETMFAGIVADHGFKIATIHLPDDIRENDDGPGDDAADRFRQSGERGF